MKLFTVGFLYCATKLSFEKYKKKVWSLIFANRTPISHCLIRLSSCFNLIPNNNIPGNFPPPPVVFLHNSNKTQANFIKKNHDRKSMFRKKKKNIFIISAQTKNYRVPPWIGHLLSLNGDLLELLSFVRIYKIELSDLNGT